MNEKIVVAPEKLYCDFYLHTDVDYNHDGEPYDKTTLTVTLHNNVVDRFIIDVSEEQISELMYMIAKM